MRAGFRGGFSWAWGGETGCVTTGSLWRFLRLTGKQLDIDLDEYQFAQADHILGVLLYCCG